MTKADPGMPRLSTPTGGAMTQPRSPAQWHGHPYVWAWHVSLASLDTAFIEARCKEAANARAPQNAAYKTGPNDPVEPNVWITVDRLHPDNRDRVRDYGLALLKWEADLEALRRKTQVRVLQQIEPDEAGAQQAPDTDTSGGQHTEQ
ncbi:hypothetical protein [Streptomyces malaysiensis]|uniref:Uncharacterized protein n=1 Tax=Streptomyces malaysiensis TaxID=92644 RepID=A0A7X5X7L0_STRMQ|nr:hypothetical protein [Streptomyces malaysiensis]NIY68115.1 hypothetical protein [Streptomyces malaysiensis]